MLHEALRADVLAVLSGNCNGVALAIKRFEAMADAIMAADDVPRVTALQRALEENPAAFRERCRAMGVLA